MVDLFHKSGVQSNLIAIGGKSLGCACGDDPLGQFSREGRCRPGEIGAVLLQTDVGMYPDCR
ncbi:hypothetical protein SDC9_205763 [bioreactor metagenome]|uniref:Uncharacterized protein n=1 Tax=bioreactor metagenome TaxID=1076179 RepID=A0A645J2X3_9ZZZZ